MRRLFVTTVMFLALSAGASAPCRAGIFIQVPFFTYSSGPDGCPGGVGVAVHVPGLVNIQINGARWRRAASPAIRGLELPVAPPPAEVPPQYDRVQPPPPEPVAAVKKPLTVREFAGTFQPAPGAYETVLVHPLRGVPVKVRFSLPDGTPRKVKVHRRELVFDYGRHLVRLRFLPDGGVRVVSR